MMKEDSGGLYHMMKEQGNVQEYKPLTPELVKEVFENLFKRQDIQPRRRVIVHTNEAGMFLFNLAMLFGEYSPENGRYWTGVIKDRKGRIKFALISLFQKGGLYKVRVYPEHGDKEHRFEFYYGTELIGKSDSIKAVDELEYKGPQTPYHIPRAKERERDGYMTEADLVTLGWKRTNKKSPFMQDIWEINKGDTIDWAEPYSDVWRIMVGKRKGQDKIEPNIYFEHYHGGGFTGIYETDKFSAHIERKSELTMMMKMLRI